MTTIDIDAIARARFGVDAVRPLQREIIERLQAQQAAAAAAAGAAQLETAGAPGPEPSPRNPDDPSTWGSVGRNEPCPCGSGKKYKHCHGKA